MAAAIRGHAAIICRAGLKQLCRPQMQLTKARADNPTLLTFLPKRHLHISNLNIVNPYIKSDCRSTISRLLIPQARPNMVPVRNKTKYSFNKGKQKTVHSIVKRFYRLHWGAWIRTRAGRAKKLYKKSPNRKYRLRQHVFCNKQQSKLLDKMVTEHWRKPRYFVDDPYAVYQKRTNLPEYFPQNKRPFYP